MEKIIRTPTKATGGITAEEKARMDDIAKWWIANAMSTEVVDVDKITDAIKGLYRVSGLKEPRVVVVPSPFVMAAAYGAAAAIWHRRVVDTSIATYSATYSATYIATLSATRSATYSAIDSATYNATSIATSSATDSATRTATLSATYIATRSATYIATSIATYNATSIATSSATDSATRTATLSATYNATSIATSSATDSATRTATLSATRSATYSAIDSATDIATYNATSSATDSATEQPMFDCLAIAGKFGVQCAKNWHMVYQGGNTWSGFPAYIAACRDVLGLKLPEFEKYHYWEQAAIHGGFRVMHPEFCIVSDRPKTLLVDENSQPHCADGPSHEWRDGSKLYHWHGVRVPAEWIEGRDTLDPGVVMRAENLEQRRAGVEIMGGWGRMLPALNGRVIEADADPEIGTVIEVDLPDLSEPERFLQVRCATGRDFALCIPKDVRKVEGYSLPHCAQAALVGLHPAEWRKPAITA